MDENKNMTEEDLNEESENVALGTDEDSARKYGGGTLWREIKSYFRMSTSLNSEAAVIEEVNKGIAFRGENLWILIFAIFIASLGLNVNSTAVIIGAMLISPLMGPIIGMGLAVAINDLEMLKRSFKNYAVATVISILTATVYFILTPYHGAQSELLARTSPTLYDVLIALFGGAAGIVAMGTGNKGNVIPGVAIATALMPPLCTAGYGIATSFTTGNLTYFIGAFYLFFINTVFIALSTFIGAKTLRFKRKAHLEKNVYKGLKRGIYIVVIIALVPAFFTTLRLVRESVFETNINSYIKNELRVGGTEIIQHTLDRDSKTLSVVALGNELSNESIERAKGNMDKYRLGGYTLQIIQGRQSDSVMILNKMLSSNSSSIDKLKATINDQHSLISDLRTELAQKNRTEALAKATSVELSLLFPGVKSLTLSNVREYAPADTANVKNYLEAVITTDLKHGYSKADKDKIAVWLKNRCAADSVKLIVINY